MTNEEREDQIFSRVAKVETDVAHLSHSIDTISSKIDALSGFISSQSRTNWTTLGTWAAVLLVLVGMWTAPMMGTISEIKVAMNEQIQYDMKSISERSILKERVDNLDKLGDSFDITIQREIRQLDEILQQEIKLLIEEKNSEYVKDITLLKEQLHTLSERILIHETLPAHNEMIKDLADINAQLAEIRANRFTSERGALLEQKIESLSQIVDDIKGEQQKRTNLIYSNTGEKG